MKLTIPRTLSGDRSLVLHDLPVELAHAGQGNWRAFRAIGLDPGALLEIARSWAAELQGVTLPWLCWNVDDDWCLVQQKLVSEIGWTPVIGFDPRAGAPRKRVPGAVVVDFNKALGLPVLYPHFPLEFAFLFTERIAFWHSDLLIWPEKMQRLGALFRELPDGQTAAVWMSPGRRHLLSRRKRFWELVGCTTRAASRDQFEQGCGWWMSFWAHPNMRRGASARRWYYWDHGGGIYYWKTRAGRTVVALDGRDYQEGHFTKIGNPAYQRFREAGSTDARRSMSAEIRQNFDLEAACRSLGLPGP
ncbi:MAG TPA: hypothetical protein VFN42_07175 [Acetobacteraceae bacterium]|nr:hypothetical protein [Acetobacteraceae bacterium]